MKITDKLDYIHVVDLAGEGTISDLFKKLGEKMLKAIRMYCLMLLSSQRCVLLLYVLRHRY